MVKLINVLIIFIHNFNKSEIYTFTFPETVNHF